MRLMAPGSLLDRRGGGAAYDLFDEVLPSIEGLSGVFDFEMMWPGTIFDEGNLALAEVWIRYDVEWQGGEVQIERRGLVDPGDPETFAWRLVVSL